MTQFQSENIKFPCRWNGSLVVKAGTAGTEEAIRNAYSSLQLSDATVTAGNQSRGGSYVTWKVSAEVPDLNTLRTLFHTLENLPGVRMLI